MYLRWDQKKRYARAPAKLNLFLEILDRRADGFHELETLMVPIRLYDSLAFLANPSGGGGERAPIALDVQHCTSLRERDPVSTRSRAPAGNENLVVKALELLRVRSGCEFGAEVQLVKRIPVAAGLGGGSSDAAAALHLANSAWGLYWPTSRLAEVASEIGSDVPFFLYGGPAICRGRGERVAPVRDLRAMHFVVVKPAAGISTIDVYRTHTSMPIFEPRTPFALPRGGERLKPQHRWEPVQWMHNRLQAAAAAISPWVDRLQSVFCRLDVLGHQLSGSGSAYFGVCRNAQHARRLATFLRTQQLGLVYATRSRA